MSRLIKIIRLPGAIWKVAWAYMTNNWRGKREDVHGRTYRRQIEYFGFWTMVGEYLNENSWGVR